MRHHIHLLPIAIGLISLMFMGVATQQGAFGAPEADQPGIVSLDQFKEALPDTAEELDLTGFLALKENGPVTILDVRNKEAFAERHLAGSVNAPLTDLTEKTLPVLAADKARPVVLVCDYSFFPTRMLSMTLQAYPVLKA
ncbi:MAG TPA: rhodanese-like domain-containing protein, partial [Patescibacteria group bacterium]|nr:rhodanese-like domain-containing protein [Patescibacteria group bacterium]